MHDRQKLGALGEDLAAAHLEAAGLRIVQRNWRASLDGVRGELDLIAVEGDTLVVVEVKIRSTARAGGARLAVGWDKRRRLRRLTALYLGGRPHPGPVRGDVVAIDGDGAGGWTVRHLRGVW